MENIYHNSLPVVLDAQASEPLD